MATIFTAMTAKKADKKPEAESGPWELYKDSAAQSDETGPWSQYVEPDPKNIDPEEITPAELRLRVANVTKPEDKLAVIRGQYPNAVKHGEDNFIFTDPETGKTHYYDTPLSQSPYYMPSLNDLVSLEPDAAELTGNVLGGLFGGAALSETGPGAIGGAVVGAGLGGAGAKKANNALINAMFGDPDTRSANEQVIDFGKDAAINGAGEGVGKLLGAGFKAGKNFFDKTLVGNVPDKVAAQEAMKAADELGVRPTLGTITQNPKTLQVEANAMKNIPNGKVAATVKTMDDAMGGKVKEISQSMFQSSDALTDHGVGGLLKKATQDANDNIFKRLQGNYTDVDALLGQTPMSGKNLQKTFAEMQAEKKALNATEKLTKGPTLDSAMKLGKSATDDVKKGLPFDKAREMRTSINGASFGASDPYEKSLNRKLYDAMTGDLTDTAKGVGDVALAKFSGADAAYSEFVKKGGTKQLLGKALRGGEPTKVLNFYSKQAIKAPETLGQIKDVITKEGGTDAWSAFVAKHVQDLGQKSVGTGKEFSPGQFVKDINALPPETKKVLYSGNFADFGDNLNQLQKLAGNRANSKLVRGETPSLTDKVIGTLLKRGVASSAIGAVTGGLDAGLIAGGAQFAASKGIDAYKNRLLTNPDVIRAMVGIASKPTTTEKATHLLLKAANNAGLNAEMRKLLDASGVKQDEKQQ